MHLPCRREERSPCSELVFFQGCKVRTPQNDVTRCTDVSKHNVQAFMEFLAVSIAVRLLVRVSLPLVAAPKVARTTGKWRRTAIVLRGFQDPFQTSITKASAAGVARTRRSNMHCCHVFQHSCETISHTIPAETNSNDFGGFWN